MKIVKQAEVFKPISIVLESQDEVNWMYELTGNISGAGEARKFFDNIYYSLEDGTLEHDTIFEENDTLQLKAKY